MLARVWPMPFVILNVDRQSASSRNRSFVLRSQGYLVKESGSGREAVAIAGRECLTAVVIGAELEDMSGLDLARCFKSHPVSARVPLLLIGRESSADADRLNSASSGAETCLIEPVDPIVLRATLQWLAGGRANTAPDYMPDRWRAMVEAVPQLLWIARPDGWVEYCSSQWIRYTGAPEWRHLGFGWLEAVHPDDRERNRSSFLQALAGGQEFLFEQRLRRHDGVYRRFRTSASPLRNDAGEVLRWVCSCDDIEDEKAAVDALKRRERELQTVLDNLPVGVWFTDSDGKIIFSNPAAQRIWGGARYVGIPDYAEYKAWWPATGKQLQCDDWALTRALKKGETSIAEMLHIECFDGSRKTILNSAVPVLGENSDVIGAVAINEDITERRAQEEALRRSRERLALVLGSIELGVWYCDLPVDKLEWNEQCKAHFGLPPEAEITPRTFFDGLHPEDRDRVMNATDAAIKHHEPFDGVYRTVAPDGTVRWIRALAQASYAPDGTPVRFDGITLDISHAKHTEEALRASEENLRKANEELRRSNEDLKQFSHAASHDLQEPLRMISLYGEWLRREYQSKFDERADAFLGIIANASKRMRQLLGDVIEYGEAAQISGPPLKQVAAGEVLETVLERLRPELEGCGGKVFCEPLPRVGVRAFHLETIFRHLLSNAIKFRGEAQLSVRVSACLTGNEWTFAVSDNGRGMEPSDANRIFGIFTRLQGYEVPGTGMGLALCQKIVERYGGRMWAESEPGKGATLYFTLPSG